MSDNFEKLVRKVSVKTSLIIIVLFFMIFSAYIVGYKFNLKFDKFEDHLTQINIPKTIDYSELYKKNDDIKNVSCPVCEHQTINKVQKSENNNYLKFIQLIYMARERLYLGGDFYNLIADYKEINNDDKIKFFISEISRYADIEVSTNKLLQLFELVTTNPGNIQTFPGNNNDFLEKIINYFQSLIKIRKLNVENHDENILQHIKMNIINREPDLALKNISNINKKNDNLEILRQNLQDLLSLMNLFNELIHYILASS